MGGKVEIKVDRQGGCKLTDEKAIVQGTGPVRRQSTC